MNIDIQPLLLRSKDVDMFRRIRLSRLFELFQEASIRHTEALGMGREKTLDRGILWVLLMQRAEIARMPEYDETIVLKSWPGKTMHLLFPRYYSVETDRGEPLIHASALWSLMDARTRKVVFPERCGVAIEGTETGEEIALPKNLPRLPADALCAEKEFTVPYSFVDLNGHMNNTRYFDLAEDCLGAAAAGGILQEIETEYASEAPFGSSFVLRWADSGDGTYRVSGEGEKPVFRMRLKYRDTEGREERKATAEC